MNDLREQRICIRFCVKLRKTDAETVAMIQQAFGEKAMTQSKIIEWHKHFREGRISVEDNSRSKLSSTCTLQQKQYKVNDLISSNRRVTVHEVADRLNIPFDSRQSIPQNLGYRRNVSKFVPRILSIKRKEPRTEVPEAPFEEINPNDDFLKIFVTDNKTWVVTRLSKTSPKSREQNLKLLQKRHLRKSSKSREYTDCT